jgi:hypothetical protein
LSLSFPSSIIINSFDFADSDKRAQADAAAASEMKQLREENTELKTRLMNAMESMELLAREVADLKHIKTAAMDLVRTCPYLVDYKLILRFDSLFEIGFFVIPTYTNAVGD